MKFGWLPSLPDFRDYHAEQHGIVKDSGYLRMNGISKVDWRKYSPWINDQGNIGSCTANAGQSLMGFMQKVAFGSATPGSRIFLYAMTRYLMNKGQWKTGDTGAYIRNTLGALATYGLPPEAFCKYSEAKFDAALDPALYGLADDFRAIKYFRHDAGIKSPMEILTSVKTNIAAKIPVMFGFTCYSSIDNADNGRIPYPEPKEQIEGGHAVLALGYDDNLKIGKSTGALLIQNSWGKSWGEGGFGWLPYQYVLTGLATDFWSVTSAAYLETGQFGF